MRRSRRTLLAAALAALAAGAVRDLAADTGPSMAPGTHKFTGHLRVEHVAPDDMRVRAIVLITGDGRRIVLDPSENGRVPAGMDGALVEIDGELQQGYGGGPFLHLRSLKRLR